MKHFLFLLVIASCGRVENNPNRLPEGRSFNPVSIDLNEKTRLLSLCNALKSKAMGLSQTTISPISFRIAQKNCSKESGLEGEETTVSVSITPEFKLRRTDNGNPFIYPDVETSSSGVMETVCTNLDTATNPRLLDNGNSLWITTSVAAIQSTDCSPLQNEICLLLETGIPRTGNHDITTKEWIKFQIDPLMPKYGFFTERKTLTTVTCGENETSQTKAVLIP